MENPNFFIRKVTSEAMVRLEVQSGFMALYKNKDLTKVPLKFDGDEWCTRVDILREGQCMFIGGNSWARALSTYGIKKDFTLNFQFDYKTSTIEVGIFSPDFIRLQVQPTEFRLGSELNRVTVGRSTVPAPVSSNEGLIIDHGHNTPLVHVVDDSSDSDDDRARMRSKNTSQAKLKGKGVIPQSSAGVVKRKPPAAKYQSTSRDAKQKPRRPAVPRIIARESVAYQVAMAENPPSTQCCCIIMQASYLRHGKNLVIPHYFASHQLCSTSSMRTFRVAGARDYAVECILYKGGYGRAKASSWNVFAAKHNLEFGDVIAFRVNRPFRSVWEVSIYKAM